MSHDHPGTTRVVARVADKQRVLRSYGTDGTLLSSTVQVRRA